MSAHIDIEGGAGGKPLAQQFLTFMLGAERFAVSIAQVREIIEYPRLTEVPMTPEFIRGVLNLRGRVVPVIDLKARFGRGRCDITPKTCVVLVEVEDDDSQQTLGLVVDRVNAVLALGPEALAPPPDFGTQIRVDFVRAVANIDELFVLVLDLDHVLAMDELEQLSEIAGSFGSASNASEAVACSA